MDASTAPSYSVLREAAHVGASSHVPLLPLSAAPRTSLRSYLPLSIILTVLGAASITALVYAKRGSSGSGSPPDECAWGSYRLPTSAVPRAYSVVWDLSQSFAEPYLFSGSSSVEVTLSPAVACVLVHARELNIRSITGTVLGSADSLRTDSAALPVPFAADTLSGSERVILRLPAGLLGAAELRFDFVFDGILSQTAIGFYPSTFMDGDNMTRSMVQTKFEVRSAALRWGSYREAASRVVRTQLGELPRGSAPRDGALFLTAPSHPPLPPACLCSHSLPLLR